MSLHSNALKKNKEKGRTHFLPSLKRYNTQVGCNNLLHNTLRFLRDLDLGLWCLMPLQQYLSPSWFSRGVGGMVLMNCDPS